MYIIFNTKEKYDNEYVYRFRSTINDCSTLSKERVSRILGKNRHKQNCNWHMYPAKASIKWNIIQYKYVNNQLPNKEQMLIAITND